MQMLQRFVVVLALTLFAASQLHATEAAQDAGKVETVQYGDPYGDTPPADPPPREAPPRATPPSDSYGGGGGGGGGSSSGMDPILTAALQYGAGCGTEVGCCVLSVPVSLVLGFASVALIAVPVLGPFLVFGASLLVNVLTAAGTGAAVGGVETLLGNLLGSQDGNYLWTILAGIGACCGISAINTLISLVVNTLVFGNPVGGLGGSVGPIPNTASPAGSLAILASFVSLGVSVVGAVATPAIVAGVYMMTAEDKSAAAGYGKKVDPESPLAAPRVAVMAY
jgi:hypothetical protein